MSKVVLTSFDPPARNVRRSHPTKAHPAATPGGATQGACLLIAHFTRVALHPIPSSSSSPSHAVKWSGYPTEHMGEDRRSVGRGARRGADGFEPARTAVGAETHPSRIVTNRNLGVTTAQQEMALERGTDATLSRRTCSPRYGQTIMARGIGGGRETAAGAISRNPTSCFPSL
jgi:hypothetical protein